MSTLEKMKAHAEELLAKAKGGQPLTAEELKVVEIYNRLNAPKAGNAGKRSPRKNKGA